MQRTHMVDPRNGITEAKCIDLKAILVNGSRGKKGSEYSLQKLRASYGVRRA